MSDLISIIVPIFNSEQYIYDCINSVLNQTYTRFELILIDDGSSDNSVKICQNMEKRDRRIHLLSCKHKGVSAARNVGINASIGKYIFFLDSDDIIHPQLLEFLHTLIEKSHSVIAAEQYYINMNDLKESEGQLSWETNIKSLNSYNLLNTTSSPNDICYDLPFMYTYLENQKAREYFTCGDSQGLAMLLYGITGKLIRHRAIRSLFFDETLSNGEDTKFIYQLLLNGADVSVLYNHWYYHRVHGCNASKKRTIDACRSMYECEKYMCNQEQKSGRIREAVSLEKLIVYRLVIWYLESRKANDNNLSKYLVKVSKKEKRLKIFSKLLFSEKLRFILAFECFPLYWIIHILLYGWREKK